MYDYEIITKELLPNKQIYLKNLIFYALVTLLVLDIPFILISWLFFILLLKLNSFIFLTTIFIIVLIQIILITINCRNTFKQSLIELNKDEKIKGTISFTEEGLDINNNKIKRTVSWNGIKSIEANEYKLIIIFNTIGMQHIGLYFSGFNVPKDTIISEIEKYMKVKRWYYGI